MRKFRFVGNPNEYHGNPSDYSDKEKERWNQIHPYDWQEVTESDTKPIHKDTDLGHYSFEIMKSWISSPNATFSNKVSNSIFVSNCIELAKELIKQLDAESK